MPRHVAFGDVQVEVVEQSGQPPEGSVLAEAFGEVLHHRLGGEHMPEKILVCDAPLHEIIGGLTTQHPDVLPARRAPLGTAPSDR
jgi:hypothetical protein